MKIEITPIVPLPTGDWITFNGAPLPQDEQNQALAEAQYGHVLGSLLMYLGATSESTSITFANLSSPESEFTLNLSISSFIGGSLVNLWVDVTKMGLH